MPCCWCLQQCLLLSGPPFRGALTLASGLLLHFCGAGGAQPHMQQLWRLLRKMCLGVFNSRSGSDSLSGERLAAFALRCFYTNTQNTVSLRNNLCLPSQPPSRHVGPGEARTKQGSRQGAAHTVLPIFGQP